MAADVLSLVYSVSGPRGVELEQEWLAKRDRALKELAISDDCAAHGAMTPMTKAYGALNPATGRPYLDPLVHSWLPEVL